MIHVHIFPVGPVFLALKQVQNPIKVHEFVVFLNLKFCLFGYVCLMTLTFLKSAGELSCRMTHSLDLSNYFHLCFLFFTCS